MPVYLQRLLIKPGIYLLFSILILVGVILQLQVIVDDIEQSFDQEQRKVDSLFSELRQTTQNLALVQKYQQAFTSLKQQGLIGDKQRADWIDKMMEVVVAHQAKDVSFELKPRTSLTKAGNINLNTRFVRYESVSFSGNFQHETEALSFLSSVKERVEPLMLVDQCAFSLVTKDVSQQYRFQYQPTKGNITLKCQFFWLELQLPAPGMNALGN